jgi:hypothetical protein
VDARRTPSDHHLVVPAHDRFDLDFPIIFVRGARMQNGIRIPVTARTSPFLDENIIDEGEWRAKRSKVLAEPLKPGDLRLDLGMVKELHDGKVICDDEQAELRATLLGIGKKHKK